MVVEKPKNVLLKGDRDPPAADERGAERLLEEKEAKGLERVVKEAEKEAVKLSVKEVAEVSAENVEPGEDEVVRINEDGAKADVADAETIVTKKEEVF